MAIGQIPVTKDNSVSGASGPSKAEPSVSYSKNKLGEGQVQTVTDGKTKVITSTGESTGSKAGDDISRGARQNYFNQNGKWPPCINTDCKSYGRPHPNCLCFGPMSQAGKFEYAQGGCVGPHHESCEHYAEGGQVAEQTKFSLHPQNSLDHVAAEHGLLHLLTKTGHNGQSKNEHKYLEDYFENSKKGHKTVDSHVKRLIVDEKLDLDPDKGKVEALKSHLDDLEQNPGKAFDVGGHLGKTLPDHAAALGSKTAQAMNYFKGLKPMKSQNSPLDPVTEPTKSSKHTYDRQLGIAENPMLVLHHAKHGTLQPQDLITLHTLYPALGQSMTGKAGEAVIDAKQKDVTIPRIQRHGLSSLLGQPLSTTQTPMAMQAIIKANMPMQAPQGQKPPKKASGTELKQIDKTNDLLATPNQSRLLNKKQ